MTTDTSDTAVFATKDYWLSGALLAAGKQILRLDWRAGRAFFCFSEAERCREASSAYWNGTLMVSAKSFADALRTLKDRLHSHQNGDDDNGHPLNPPR